MLAKIKQYFKEKIEKETQEQIIKKEIGYDNSNLYATGDFHKYDPDLLKQRKGYNVYNEMMLDDQVKPVMEFKKNAVVSREWYFDIDEDNEQHQEIADFFNEAINQIKGSWRSNLLLILSAMKYGYSICEKNAKDFSWNDKMWWGYRDIKLRPFETFDGGMQIDEHGNVTQISQIQAAHEVILPMDKIIYFVYRKDIDPHYGESDLRAAYRPYWAKDIAIKLHNLYLERLAGGFIDAEYEGNLTTEEKTALKSLINNVSGKMGSLHPKKVQLKLFPAVKTDAYIVAIAMYDKAISKALLVPNLLGLTEQSNTGSYAQSETHKEMFFYVLNAIAKELEEIVNEQVFQQLALWNFGTKDFPRYRFNEYSNEQKEIITRNWGDLIQKGAVTKTNSDEAHIRNLLDFPEKEEEDEKEEQEDMPPKLPNLAAPDDIEGDGNITPPNAAPSLGGEQKQYQERVWLKRVNFAELGKKLDKREDLFKRQLADIMGQVKESLQKQIMTIVGKRSMGNVKFGEFKALQIPKKFKIGLKNIVKDNLSKTVEENIEQARKELPKKFAEKLIGPGMDTTQIARFLKEKSEFFITGLLEKDILDQYLALLQNGILYDKSLTQMIVDIEKDSKLIAALPKVDAAGRPVNIPARLENIARTNISGAMNMGRTNMFARDEYKGFIEAFEYSAILDDRTTDICDSLNGRIRKDWGNYTPPNHFQCRSVLVPVTILDEWDGKESNIPGSAKPHEGFG